jgi:hypothetical protein
MILDAAQGDQSTSWKVLRILTYYSISANLIAAGSAIWAITYLAWMPVHALGKKQKQNKKQKQKQKQEEKPDDDEGAAATIPPANEGGWVPHDKATKLVRSNPGFRFQYYVAVISYGVGLTLTLAVILGWVWLTMSHAEGIALFALVLPCFLCTVWPLFRALHRAIRGEHPWMFDLPESL